MLKSCGCDAMTGAGGSFLGRGSESKERNGLGRSASGSVRAARQKRQEQRFFGLGANARQRSNSIQCLASILAEFGRRASPWNRASEMQSDMSTEGNAVTEKDLDALFRAG